MQPDNRTISEIVENPEPEDEATEDDEHLGDVTAEVSPDTFVPSAISLDMAVKHAESITARREEANIPPQIRASELEGKTFVIAEKMPQKAFLPADGTRRDGWQCICVDLETGKPFTVWFGQITLKKDLDSVRLPVKVTLEKRGRTWIFS